MAGSTLKSETCKELSELFALLSRSTGDTLGSIVNRPLTLSSVETRILDDQALLSELSQPYVVATGSLDKDYADKSMAVMFEIQDAIAMSGMLMMTPEEVIEQRRAAGVIEGEEAEALNEFGNVLFSGIGEALRSKVDNIDVSLGKHGVVKPGANVDGLLEAGVLVAHTFTLQVGDYPETTGFMVTDLGTAESWNKGALASDHGAGNSAGNENRAASSRIEDPVLEAIPAAPIRGVLAAFVAQPEVFRTLRHSCRRVGLDLRRHGKGEIPNPAAHRDQILLVDVPPGEDRQFDWCQRIKDFATENKVVLLLHHPSRSRVTQAFLSKADVILGFPCDEMQLSQKLDSLLGEAPPQEE